MFVSDIVRRSGRSLKNAKARTILTAMAIAVGTFALTLTLAASNGAQGFVNQIISDNFDPAELIVAKDEIVFGRGDTSKPKEYNENFGGSLSQAGAPIQIEYISEADVEKIRAVDGVAAIREGVDINLEFITRAGQKKYVGTTSVFNPFQKPELLAGEIPSPLGEAEILLPEAFIEPLGFVNAPDAIGKEIVLAVQEGFGKSVKEETFTVVAVLKKPTTAQPGTELYTFIGLDDAKRINDAATRGTENYRKYQYVFVNVADGEDQEKLKAVQDKLKQVGFASQSAADTQKFLTQIIDVLRAIVAGFGLIAVIASVFGVVNTMYISVLQRTREIGLMKALGMRRLHVAGLFIVEAAWIGLIGGLLGAVPAILIGTGANPAISKALELGDTKLLIFSPAQIGGLIFALVVIAIIAGLLPAYKASKLDPIEALRTE
jgi:putative ABC transport system permease protein